MSGRCEARIQTWTPAALPTSFQSVLKRFSRDSQNFVSAH